MFRNALFLSLLLSLSPAHGQVPAASPTPASAPSPRPPSTATPPPPTVSGVTSRVRVAPPTTAKVTFSQGNVDGPYIAMTFDDGPSGAKHPAAARSRGQEAHQAHLLPHRPKRRANPQLVQRELAEGHEICNHSYTHPDLAKMSDDAVRAEIQKTQDAIITASGYRPILMRPPYGALTARQRNGSRKDFGVKIILWDVDPLDWKAPGPSVVASGSSPATRPGRSSSRTISTRRPSMRCRRFSTRCWPRGTNLSPSPSCWPWTRARSPKSSRSRTAPAPAPQRRRRIPPRHHNGRRVHTKTRRSMIGEDYLQTGRNSARRFTPSRRWRMISRRRRRPSRRSRG